MPYCHRFDCFLYLQKTEKNSSEKQCKCKKKWLKKTIFKWLKKTVFLHRARSLPSGDVYHLARPILWFRRSDAGSDRPNHLFWLKISSVVDCCCYFVVRIWKQGWFGLAIVYSNREIEFNYYLISSGSDISITKSGARAVQTRQSGSDVWMFWGFGRMTSHNIWTICEDY